MELIQKPLIKLKEYIDKEDYVLINNLQEQCTNKDKTAVKLELDYKLADSAAKSSNIGIRNVNEFMYFDGQQLVGYVGICSFGGHGAQLEVNGMVHPDYRRIGVFQKLMDLVADEWKRRNSKSMLLLCDRKSSAGQKSIEKTGARYHHSEFEMFQRHGEVSVGNGRSEITFRKATNADALEITRQNAVYFNDESESINENDNETFNNENMILPEEEEKRGMTIYLAEKDNNIIGKVHMELNTSTGGIYGLGVLPEYRGNGFGRELLLFAVDKLRKLKAEEIMLQVAADNDKAMNLYKSCGFQETSTMDYYEIKKA